MNCDWKPTKGPVIFLRCRRCGRRQMLSKPRDPADKPILRECRGHPGWFEWTKAGNAIELAIWITTGEKKNATCGCAVWIKNCNAWGWKGTWRHRQEILQVLADNAEKRGYSVVPTLRSMAWAATRAAFSRKNFRRIRATLAQTLGGGVD